MALTFWTGPVSYAMTENAVVPGSVHKVIECSGLTKPPFCKDVSASLLGGDGRRLPNLLDKVGAGGDPIVLAAFSAGGRLVRDLVSQPADRAMVRAVMTADATYSDGTPAAPLVSSDWVELGVYAADPSHGFLWSATASPSPNYGRPTAVETLAEIRRQVEARTGGHFEPVEGYFGISPAPAEAVRLGNVVFASYALEPLYHGGHVKLAEQTFRNILVPWLSSGSFDASAPASSKSPSLLGAVAFGLAAAGGYFAGRRILT